MEEIFREWLNVETRRTRQGSNRWHTLIFAASKRLFDVVSSLLVFPILLGLCGVFLVLNPFLNPGRLFFVQDRMGKHGRRFRIVKFRTMTEAGGKTRSHDDDVEEDRITRLGSLMRKFRIDEIPNFINVFRGEMSLVGPRPDVYSYAEVYNDEVPLYQERHRVRPGITGLAQVEMGYAEGVEMTVKKAAWDARYVEAYGFRQELRIISKTIAVVLSGFGAK